MREKTRVILLAVLMIASVGASRIFAEEIVIGFSGPLSGPAAEYGQDCLNGIEMAVGEINAGGGVLVKGQRLKIRVEKRDDRVDPAASLENAQELRNSHKALAIFNPVTNTLASMMGINEKPGREFLIMAYSSVPGVSETGNKLLVAITTPFTTYVRNEADLAWSKGWRRGAMVVTSGAYGEGWRKAFSQIWTQKGGLITIDKPTNYYVKTEFVGPLQAALETDPDFLLIGGPSATTAMIVEQARARGFEGGFVLTDQVNLDALYQLMEKPLCLEGAIGVAMLSHISYPASGSFTQSYKSSYLRNPTWECVLNYVGMHALAKAIFLAGTSDDVRSIRLAFSKVMPLLGDIYPVEVYGLTPGGRFIISSSIQTFRYGRFTKPTNDVWWANTIEEYNQVKKITKSDIPPVWKKYADQ